MAAINPPPAIPFTPDQEREFRNWAEKDLAHVEHLFAVTRAALRDGNLPLAKQYMGSLVNESFAMNKRLAERIGVKP